MGDFFDIWVVMETVIITAALASAPQTSLCLFGNQDNCTFPCRCNNFSCDPVTGTCLTNPVSCPEGKPEGYPWGGPGCQVGNIAYGKDTESNSDVNPGVDGIGWYKPEKWNNSGNVVDGSLSRDLYGGHCTLIRTLPRFAGIPAWWAVDLGALHHIHNVTIINNNEYFVENLRNYEVKMGNTISWAVNSDSSCDICGMSEREELGNNITFTCKFTCFLRVNIAKYVAIRNRAFRYPEHLHYFPEGMILCEVIIMGNLYIEVFWDRCLDEPSNGIWCQECKAGWMIPDCKKLCPYGSYGNGCGNVCPSGYYGYYCDMKECIDNVSDVNNTLCPRNDQSCSYCNNVSSCLENKHCVSCLTWYAGDVCEQYISPRNLSSPVNIIQVSNTSIKLEVKFNTEIPQYLAQYYYYTVEYKEDFSNADMLHKDASTIPHVFSVESTVISLEKLTPNTHYQLFIRLNRRHGNVTDIGEISQILFVKTGADSTGTTALPSFTTEDAVELKTLNQKTNQITFIICGLVGGIFIILAAVSAICETKKRYPPAGSKPKENYLNEKLEKL